MKTRVSDILCVIVDKKFTFHHDFFKVSAPNVYFERITLFFYYNDNFFSHKDSHLEGNYKSMGGFL